MTQGFEFKMQQSGPLGPGRDEMVFSNCKCSKYSECNGINDYSHSLKGQNDIPSNICTNSMSILPFNIIQPILFHPLFLFDM